MLHQPGGADLDEYIGPTVQTRKTPSLLHLEQQWFSDYSNRQVPMVEAPTDPGFFPAINHSPVEMSSTQVFPVPKPVDN